MARWLVQDVPVKFLQFGERQDGYIYFNGQWVEGYGYFTHCSLGVNGPHAIGWLQLDGTFTHIRKGDKYKHFRPHYHHAVSGKDIWVLYDEWVDFANKNFKLDTYLGDGAYRRVTYPQYATHGYRNSMYSLIKDNANEIRGYFAVIDGKLQRNTVDTMLGWEALTGELWSPLPTNPDRCVISKARGNDYYIIHESGRVAVFDRVQEQLIRNDIWIDDFDAAGFHHARVSYCQEHDFFVAICKAPLLTEPPSDCDTHDPGCYKYDRTTTMRIYLNKGYPYALSTPLPTNAPVKTGVVNEIWTQLTGEQGEVIENYLVDWAITAGEGQLTSSQSETDASGIARIGYLPPANFGGTVTIEATVKH